MKLAASVFSIPGPFALRSWYAVCIASGMLNMLTTPALTFVFLGIVVGLGTAFVWVLWEFEQTSRHVLSKASRRRDRVR
jgi:hypothetical protein